jgi:hypothetical protein
MFLKFSSNIELNPFGTNTFNHFLIIFAIIDKKTNYAIFDSSQNGLRDYVFG